MFYDKIIICLFPGLYIGFCHSFDIMQKTPYKIYFVATSIGKKNILIYNYWWNTYISPLWKIDIITMVTHTKKIFESNYVYFIDNYMLNNITWTLGDTNFIFLCWKDLSRVRDFQHEKIKFVSLHTHVISSIIFTVSHESTTLEQISYDCKKLTAQTCHANWSHAIWLVEESFSMLWLCCLPWFFTHMKSVLTIYTN
jgi:hypothetical protein